MLPLRDSSLSELSGRLRVPAYDRRALTSSVVHIGVGGFHRAHQAVYLDDLAAAGHTGWGSVGVSLRSDALRCTLDRQDGLYTVVELGPHGEQARVVGAMTDYLFGPHDPGAVVRRLADPDTRLVTLTVTGDGYAAGGTSAPSWTDHVVAALARRRVAGLGGFTVLSCDNLGDSGAAARGAVLARAAHRDETLARWIDRNVTFPDTMVDRITPGTDDGVRRMVAERYGLRDRSPVATEPFRQWVVEDSFAQGRPPLEDVGVRLVSDVAPYKTVKSRLLNGTHTAMAYLGVLAGHETSADVVADPLLRTYLTALMRQEVAPHLPLVAGMDPEDYIASVLDRLGNRRIADPIQRLSRRGSTKVPAYLLPSLADAAASGQRAPLLSLALAGWFRYLRGTDERGRLLDVEDARIAELRPLALRAGTDPRPLLGVRDLMGPLGDDPWVRHQVREALGDLEHGVARAVHRALGRSHVIDEVTGVRAESGLIS